MASSKVQNPENCPGSSQFILGMKSHLSLVCLSGVASPRIKPDTSIPGMKSHFCVVCWSKVPSPGLRPGSSKSIIVTCAHSGRCASPKSLKAVRNSIHIPCNYPPPSNSLAVARPAHYTMVLILSPSKSLSVSLPADQHPYKCPPPSISLPVASPDCSSSRWICLIDLSDRT